MKRFSWFNRVFRRSRPPMIESAVKALPRLDPRGIIEQAALRAEHRPHQTGSSDVAMTTLNDDLALLRKSFAGYELTERLHHGGQGIVYRARQRSTGRLVAIKVLLHGPFATRAQRLRFDREIALVSRLRHPNIVTLYESGLVAGRQYFAMEFVEGLPIDRYVILNDLSVRECVEMFVVVSRAVSRAHQCGILHRDLKPSNILVDSEGTPHLLDFGLAKDLTGAAGSSSDSSPSFAGQVLGTWRYLSPEQAYGVDNDVDVRSDIYTLAVVLFESLTGRMPYPVGDATPATLARASARDPIRLREGMGEDLGGRLTVKDVDCDLEAIVAKALETEQSRRYQSAAALADDLDRWLAGVAVEARSASRFYLLRKAARQYRTQLVVLAVFVALLVGSLVGMTILWRRSERVAQIAQAGLQMGSILKLGSVQRDNSRIDQAVSMFEQAIKVGETVQTSDPLVRRNLYAAHHELAELFYQNGDAVSADPHCRQAVAIADGLVADAPERLEFRRLQGFAHILEGRMADARGETERALASFAKAASIRADLVTREEENPSLKSELALARTLQGKCCRKLKRLDDANEFYSAAHALQSDLVEANPTVPDYALDLASIEISLAAWHISQKDPEQDRVAWDWLGTAERRLIERNELGQLTTRQRDFDRNMEAIARNKQLLIRRAEKRGQRIDQLGSPPLSTSTGSSSSSTSGSGS